MIISLCAFFLTCVQCNVYPSIFSLRLFMLGSFCIVAGSLLYGSELLLYLLFVLLSFVVLFFFFFKQKTAYELRISDWSSDVCSSDLLHANPDRGVFGLITNGVAYQINHDLQRPSKFSNGRQRFIGVRRLNANLVVRSFYCEQARGAPRNISKVDVFHHGIEIRP